MKTVFPNREIPHKWAHATQDHARGSNLSFQGDTLYSYSTPIAKIYGDTTGECLVLMSERSYSVTTAKHIGYARRAVSHLPVISVPSYAIGHSSTGQYRGNGSNTKADHADNLAYLQKSLADCGTRAMRRATEERVRWDAESAERAHKALADYMIFFNIRRKMPAMPGFAAAFERARKLENPDPASLDKREREKAQRNEHKRRAEFYRVGCARTNWRLDGAFGVAPMFRHRADGSCMLRVNGEDIETSLGARVPLAAAPMVWNLVQRAKTGGGYKASPAAGYIRIGDYPLDRIDADGTLHAGCHAIPYSELEVMARRLGL